MSDLKIEAVEYEKHLRGAFEEIRQAVMYAHEISSSVLPPNHQADLWKIAEMILARADYTHQGEEGSDISLDDLLSH